MTRVKDSTPDLPPAAGQPHNSLSAPLALWRRPPYKLPLGRGCVAPDHPIGYWLPLGRGCVAPEEERSDWEAGARENIWSSSGTSNRRPGRMGLPQRHHHYETLISGNTASSRHLLHSKRPGPPGTRPRPGPPGSRPRPGHPGTRPRPGERLRPGQKSLISPCQIQTLQASTAGGVEQQ